MSTIDLHIPFLSNKSDDYIEVDVPIGGVTPLSRGTLHKKQNKTPESVGAQKNVETINIDDDDDEPTKSTPPSKIKSIISSDASSPIDDASALSVIISPKKTAKKKPYIDIHVESKHAASRKANKKPITLAQRLPPKLKPRTNPADDTSLIDDFPSFAPPSSEARDGSSSVLMAQIKAARGATSTVTAASPPKNPYTKAKAAESSSTAAALNAAKKPSTAAREKVHAHTSSTATAKAATKLPTAKALGGCLSSDTVSKPAKKPSAAKGRGKEASPEKISVFAYTVKAQAEADVAGAKGTKKYLQFLEGCTILHIGFDFNSKFMGDSTKKRITKVGSSFTAWISFSHIVSSSSNAAVA